MLKGYMNSQATSKVENTLEKDAYVGENRNIGVGLRICGLGSTVPGTVLSRSHVNMTVSPVL